MPWGMRAPFVRCARAPPPSTVAISPRASPPLAAAPIAPPCFVCPSPLAPHAHRRSFRLRVVRQPPVSVAKRPRGPPPPTPTPVRVVHVGARASARSSASVPLARVLLTAVVSLCGSRSVAADGGGHSVEWIPARPPESAQYIEAQSQAQARHMRHDVQLPNVVIGVKPVRSTAYATALAPPVGTADLQQPTAGEAVLASLSKSRGVILFAAGMFVVGAALAAAETAITTMWPWKVRELAEKEGPTSPFAVLDSDLTRFLTTILVTTTASTVFSTAIATDLAGEVLPARSMAYFTACLTVFFLFFGEILPKALAVHSPAQVARVMVPVIGALSRIVFPLGQLLAACSSFILRVLKVPHESDGAVSEQELRLIVAGADRSGTIKKYESEIIENVLDLEQKDVREVMCPRVDIVAVEATESLARFLELERDSRYSRMPVFDGSIDNVVGYVYAKALLRYLQCDPSLLEETAVQEIMDPAFFVMESMSVWTVLEQMRKRRLHLAVVVDEWGGTAGLVTLEDILEEVVGEILDEDDDDEAAAVDFELIADGRYVIEGAAELDKVVEELQIELNEDDEREYGTVSGLLCALMGTIPDVGDTIVVSNWRFEVREADDRRILSVFAVRLSEDELKAATVKDEGEGEASDGGNGNDNNGGGGGGNGVVEMPRVEKQGIRSDGGGQEVDRR